ncbi:MAG: hypothetical protein JJU36_05045 [Phycisphaeraceae bacterium]|nr:hypothetical protein [Phycisphaeraceae bacterium]
MMKDHSTTANVMIAAQTHKYMCDYLAHRKPRAPAPHPVYVHGRAFRIVREGEDQPPPSHPDYGMRMAFVQPLEGGETNYNCLAFYWPLDGFEPVSLSGPKVRLRSVRELKGYREWHNGRRVEIPFAVSLEDSPADWLSYQKEEYRALGLVPGQVYSGLRWLIPQKVLTLDGVTGAYYANMFEQA